MTACAWGLNGKCVAGGLADGSIQVSFYSPQSNYFCLCIKIVYVHRDVSHGELGPSACKLLTFSSSAREASCLVESYRNGHILRGWSEVLQAKMQQKGTAGRPDALTTNMQNL